MFCRWELGLGLIEDCTHSGFSYELNALSAVFLQAVNQLTL